MYIVYTEPLQERMGHTPTGNYVKVFCRDFDEKTRVGKSKYFITEMTHIVPSYDLKSAGIDEHLLRFIKNEEMINKNENLEKKIKRLIYFLNEEFNAIKFIKKNYSSSKKVIWAILKDRADKENLPDYFLKDKYSPSSFYRWYHPPFTIAHESRSGNLVIPKLKESVSKDIILADKKCALDIETTEYEDPEKERITNVVLNFGEKKYIITSFKGVGDEFKGYDLIYAKNTDEIKNMVEGIIQTEDPLILYGFNIQFDQSKLRDLGDEEYLPGIDETRPVFKSVQGIKNMITKGRFTVDLYGFLFLYFNLFKNNKLETHAGMKKTMDHALLELKTAMAEQGDLEAVLEILNYVADDGNITYELGEKHIDNIVSRAWFAKRSTETICTTSSKAITDDYWNKKFFLRMNTYRERYRHGYKPLEFDPENKKDELLNLERSSCLEKNISLVYPKFFINAMWGMIKGTTSTLNFGTPNEKLNFCQTLNGYIACALAEYFEIKQTMPSRERIYAFEAQYRLDFQKVDLLMEENIKKMNNLLKDAGQLNYSKKFLYVKNPDEMVKEKLGFVFGTGPMISAGKKIVSLIDSKLIYQGFGLTRGKKTRFDAELAEDIIMKRLLFEDEEKTRDFVRSKISDLKTGKVPKEDLLFREKIDEKTTEYGVVDGHEIPAVDFLVGDFKPDSCFYINNFLRAFWDVISVDFRDLGGLEEAFK